MGEQRKRSRLTPLSGELKAMVEWTPTDPAADQPKRRRRKERQLPTTRRGIILRGLVRLVVVLALAAGLVSLIAGIIVWRGGSSASHVFPLTFYFAAAGVGALAVLTGTGAGRSYRYTDLSPGSAGRERAVNSSFFLGFIAVFLFAVGLLLDYLL